MFGLKTRAKILLGHAAALANPALAKEVRAGNVGGPQWRLKYLIAKAELSKLNARGDSATVEHVLTRRWTAQNTSLSYYDTYADRFKELFNGPHLRIVDWLSAFATRNHVSHVIEVGCGDGRALEALSTRMPGIPRWTGVDINADIIARNQENFADNDALAFVAADAAEWFAAHAGTDALLMSYGGVMEYIAPETLSTWFALVADKGGAGVLLVEPVDMAHDLTNDPASHLFGFESSYSHNHRALLEAAGYRIVEAAEATVDNRRWVMMLATPHAFDQKVP